MWFLIVDEVERQAKLASATQNELERAIRWCLRKTGQHSGMGDIYHRWVDRLRQTLSQVSKFRTLSPPERLDMGESYTELKTEYDAWIKEHPESRAGDLGFDGLDGS